MTAPVTLVVGIGDTLAALARLGRSDGPLEPVGSLRDAMVDLTREDGLLAQTNAGLERLAAPGSGLDSLAGLTESLAGLTALQESLERIAEVAESLDRLATTTEALPEVSARLERLQVTLDRVGGNLGGLERSVEGLEVALAPVSRLAGRLPRGRRAARELDSKPEHELPAPPSGP